MAELAEAEANDAVARKIYEFRKDAGLTQQQLAKLVGTTTSVICTLEDADYAGHSLAMLRRIAGALNKRIELRSSARRVQSRKSHSLTLTESLRTSTMIPLSFGKPAEVS